MEHPGGAATGGKSRDEDQFTQPSTRTERGINLYRERHTKIERTGPSTYLVPSCSGEHAYTVNLKPFVCCTCPDHRRTKDLGEICKHAVAATIFRAKRAAAKRHSSATAAL